MFQGYTGGDWWSVPLPERINKNGGGGGSVSHKWRSQRGRMVLTWGKGKDEDDDEGDEGHAVLRRSPQRPDLPRQENGPLSFWGRGQTSHM